MRFGVSRSKVSSRAAKKEIDFPDTRFALGCRLTVILYTLADSLFCCDHFLQEISVKSSSPLNSSETPTQHTNATP
jgi:hypothetical protein